MPNDTMQDEPPAMRLYGRSSVSEFLQDFIAYRSLQPCDPRLPGLEALLAGAGLPGGQLPRKHEPGYARLVVHLLAEARRIEQPRTALKRLVFLGDTRLGDAGAFENLCLAAGWQGIACISAENGRPPRLELTQTGCGLPLYLANRWALLAEFERACRAHPFPIDEATVVVVDLDKTAIGARGRNAAVIDQARLFAVRQTVAATLGSAFDAAAFEAAYQRLNQPEFHFFTADNQDYLAYICLVLGSNLYSLDGLVAAILAGNPPSFAAFIHQVDAQQAALPEALRKIHNDIYAHYSAGDPTPFKAFRRSEYHATAGRMGCLPDGAPVEQMLAEEIVLTQEVRTLALAWKAQGALLFGLSDKPDEASLPPAGLAAQGWLPLHRITTHAIGAAS